MKATITGLCLAAFGLVFSGCGHGIAENKLPSVVVNAVKGKYNASNIDWEKKNNGYEAEFLQGQSEVTVLVNNAGNLLMQKSDVDTTAIPATIIRAINTTYAGYTMEDIEKLEKDNIAYYQFELEKKGSKDIKVVYKQDGNPAAGVSYWD